MNINAIAAASMTLLHNNNNHGDSDITPVTGSNEMVFNSAATQLLSNDAVFNSAADAATSDEYVFNDQPTR